MLQPSQAGYFVENLQGGLGIKVDLQVPNVADGSLIAF